MGSLIKEPTQKRVPLIRMWFLGYQGLEDVNLWFENTNNETTNFADMAVKLGGEMNPKIEGSYTLHTTIYIYMCNSAFRFRGTESSRTQP